ncbi:Echinoderm microtubule-associated protein-like elp-1 [Orchesella cincta]|uniref:Echinoderm microtubule-associated protein-like elp-1 n=1 Tax=Orchesella cincta TaxID=48709 RepID=A0A1D2MVU4_ORCCI|nr:Echinoderm microtubule-associated protein-like elp-1 [Orchesella cincta]
MLLNLDSNKICLCLYVADEMLENENETLRERVGDLEKKVYEQRDEILCLRATLADVLRRITNLEGSRAISPK